MDERQRLIARARLLRRTGKTYAEIRAELAQRASDDQLKRWLRGIPRPAATFRANARDDLRRECRRLRALGLSYSEIAARTGAAPGSISPWVRDVRPMARPRERSDARARAARARGDLLHRRATARHERLRASAERRVGEITARELFLVGVALYWAEGSKAKPWRRDARVIFTNSDPDVVRLFLRWLDIVDVAAADRGFRLAIHESADVAAHESWWARQLELDETSFQRATLKREQPRTVRRNVGDSYHGCLIVSVRRSGDLYYAIEGWWRAIARGTA